MCDCRTTCKSVVNLVRRPFIPGKKPPVSIEKEGCVGPKAGVDLWERDKIGNTGCPGNGTITIQTTLAS
jgi:hypothetical protein